MRSPEISNCERKRLSAILFEEWKTPDLIWALRQITGDYPAHPRHANPLEYAYREPLSMPWDICVITRIFWTRPAGIHFITFSLLKSGTQCLLDVSMNVGYFNTVYFYDGSNWPNFEIPTCTCSTSHNASSKTDICIYRFWMERCGLWNRCMLYITMTLQWVWWWLKSPRLENDHTDYTQNVSHYILLIFEVTIWYTTSNISPCGVVLKTIFVFVIGCTYTPMLTDNLTVWFSQFGTPIAMPLIKIAMLHQLFPVERRIIDHDRS